MELYIYDTSLTLKGVIDEITSFIWIRRYWQSGEFKLLVPFTPINAKLLVKNNLIMKRGDKEAAQIQYVNIRKNNYGLEEIEIEGKFVTSWIGKRLVLKQIITTDASQSIIYRIMSENAIDPEDTDRVIPLLEQEESPPDLQSGTIEYMSEPLVSALPTIEGLAKAAKLGFVIETDIKAQKHIFKVYKGRDLTADQLENPPCIFSQEFDNIHEQEFTNSVENLKTVGYVGGEEVEGVERIVVEVGSGSGLDRSEVFINASDITQTYYEGETEITIPLQTYIDILAERGLEELEQYAEVLNFSSRINVFSNLKYKEDFDLGDRVTCIDKRWGIRIDARITEIAETYQKSQNDIEVTFGESLPTLFDKIKKMR